jgi:hypothetical protein
MNKNFFSLFILTLFSVVLLSCAVSNVEKAQATTILQTNFEQVVKGSELIFEGKAIYKETRVSPENGKPFTYFTFQVLDVMKGSYSDTTIELGFMGGLKGKFTLTVSDMRMPEVGERGVYFVEKVNVQQINPLYGWRQGHYLVVPNEQKTQDIVIPVEEADSLSRDPIQGKSLSSKGLSLKNAPTIKQFKQEVVETVKRNIQ